MESVLPKMPSVSGNLSGDHKLTCHLTLERCPTSTHNSHFPQIISPKRYVRVGSKLINRCYINIKSDWIQPQVFLESSAQLNASDANVNTSPPERLGALSFTSTSSFVTGESFTFRKSIGLSIKWLSNIHERNLCIMQRQRPRGGRVWLSIIYCWCLVLVGLYLT